MSLIDNFKSLFTKSWTGVWTTVFNSSHRSNRELYFGHIFSCIDAIAKNVARTPYGLYRKQGDEWIEVEHEALNNFKTPNNFQTDYDLLYLMSTHIDATGQAFLYPIKGQLSQKTRQIRLLNPFNIKTKASYDNIIDSYEYIVDGKRVVFTPDELVNILRPNPFSQYTGLSTIEMARWEGDNELDIIEHNNKFYENGAIPSGILSTDKQINEDSFNKLKAGVRENYQGKDNAYKLMFLTHGFKYEQVSVSQKDLEYVEQRKLNRDQILSIFQVPKSVLAISEQLNKATAQVEFSAFMQNVVEPRLNLIFTKLNRFYLPLYELDPSEYQFRYDNPVPNDRELELKEYTMGYNKWYTRNEIRIKEGLDPVEDGDTFPSNDFNLFGNPEEDQDQDQDSNDGDKEEKGVKHDHKKKESMPEPSEIKKRNWKEYTQRRNRYLKYKINKVELEVLQHVNFLIRDIKKEPIKNKSFKKEYDVDELIELNPDVVLDQLMPVREKRSDWQLALYFLLFNHQRQVSNTCGNQLKEIFKLEPVSSQTMKRLIQERAKFSSKSVTDTVMNNVRKVIANDIESGETDLRQIKRDIVGYLADQKDWKVDQIARTELVNIYAETQHQTYKDNGVETVKWLCGSDPCPICQQNCNETASLGKAFPSGHYREGETHPSCVCEVVPVV